MLEIPYCPVYYLLSPCHSTLLTYISFIYKKQKINRYKESLEGAGRWIHITLHPQHVYNSRPWLSAWML